MPSQQLDNEKSNAILLDVHPHVKLLRGSQHREPQKLANDVGVDVEMAGNGAGTRFQIGPSIIVLICPSPGV